MSRALAFERVDSNTFVLDPITGIIGPVPVSSGAMHPVIAKAASVYPNDKAGLPPVKDAGGYGLTPDYLSIRNTVWGQQQPVNYKILWKMFLEIPEVYAAIKTKVDYLVCDGYEIKAKNKLTEKKIKLFLKSNNFDKFLKDVVFSQQIFGDAYVELVRGSEVAGAESFYMGSWEEADAVIRKRTERLMNSPALRVVRDYKDDNAGAFPGEKYDSGDEKTDTYLSRDDSSVKKGSVLEFYPRDASTIRIDYNEHGEPIKYIQRVLHRRVDFYPSEMIHLPSNVVGNRQYGMSGLFSLIRSGRIKFDAEEYNADWLRNGGIPRLLYELYGFNKEQFGRVAQQLQALSNSYNRDIVLNVPNKDSVKVDNVAPTNTDMQWLEFMRYLRQQIFMALQVPPALLGESDSANRAVADVNMEMFDKHIRGLKRELEEQLNTKFFVKDVIGFDDVEFSFHYDNVREELKKAQRAQLLSTMPFITPDEVREMLDLPPLAEIDTSSFDAIAEIQQRNMPEVGPDGKPMGGGKFNPGAPGVKQPNKSDDRERNAERQNVEAARDTKGATAVKYWGDRAGRWDRVNSGTQSVRAYEYEHPRSLPVSVNTSRPEGESPTPETRYPFGATLPAEPEHGAISAQAWDNRMDEIRGFVFNPLSNAADLNHDRRFPADKLPPKKPKPKAERYKAEGSPEKDEVTAEGNENPNWVDGYRSIGATESRKALEEKAIQIAKAIKFLDSNDSRLEKKLEV